MHLPSELSSGQFQLVYNILSLTIASMLASFAFFIMVRSELTAKYRPAMVMSSLVVGIAAYHYWRIFNSWEAAYQLTPAGNYVASGKPFNDAYRYVDWLLTVPLLVAEFVAVLALPRSLRGSLMGKLVVASALMILLGYPGEISREIAPRAGWAIASTIPFIYILYVLFTSLSKAAADNSGETKDLLRGTRLLLLATWGFYPIAYALPLFGIGSAAATIGVQIGYSISDIAAKCGYGMMIYLIARAKMRAENASELGFQAAPVAA